MCELCIMLGIFTVQFTNLNFPLLCQEDDEFRDKLTPISLALNYSLAPPSHGQDLPPVLNHYSSTFLQEHVSIYCTLLKKY